ncbi:hypothetical protein ACFS2C_23320 [Prauserella oleivorans]|uniref:Copper-binding protein n=1 Tax=Prauserella oleivorans TaxID=1478153 RepID=A0ABW5WFR7_9PSEU
MSRKRVFRRDAVGAALGIAGLVLAGCGGPDGADDAASQPAGDQPAGKRATVTLTDFRIELSQKTFTPGTYTFVVTNDGKAPHALDIEGPGFDENSTETLDAGESANLTATLGAETYDFYCPVSNHREIGMETKVAVGGKEAPTTDGGTNGY